LVPRQTRLGPIVVGIQSRPTTALNCALIHRAPLVTGKAIDSLTSIANEIGTHIRGIHEEQRSRRGHEPPRDFRRTSLGNQDSSAPCGAVDIYRKSITERRSFRASVASTHYKRYHGQITCANYVKSYYGNKSIPPPISLSAAFLGTCVGVQGRRGQRLLSRCRLLSSRSRAGP
jgi:hypothetical protein